ncbi:unnamed protein product [Linum tenue]|uniref:Uncharacterized protein n=1 Tax=Linum tenue TaxID=586396 RepID=A0AAV0N7R4_9ROSI|nr:unnamed protein product [Linum tenue]
MPPRAGSGWWTETTRSTPRRQTTRSSPWSSTPTTTRGTRGETRATWALTSAPCVPWSARGGRATWMGR